MQDSSKSQQRRRGQKNSKPLSNTEVASLTPKQLTLPHNMQKENNKQRNSRRRNRNKKGLTSNANSNNQNDETLMKNSKSKLVNKMKGDNKVLDSTSFEETLYVPKQADFSRKQPETSLKHCEEALYIQKQSEDSKKAKRRNQRRKSKSNANINQVLSKSDSTNLLVKPSRSEPVSMTDSTDESLNEKSKEELIALVRFHQSIINRTINQNLKEDEKNFESEKKKPNEDRRFFVLNEKLIAENETIDYKDHYLSTLLDEKKTLNIQILLQTACSFLNNQGGRIYLGIRDEECQVKGMYLTKKDRDQIQNFRVLWFKSIYPCALDKITIRFVPVKEEKRFSKIPGLFVVKIVVKPGKPGILYSTSVKKCKYWMRFSCSTLILKPDNLFEIFKQKQLEEAKHILHAWDDPDLEADLIDMTKIHPLRVQTKEAIEKDKFEEFIKEAGISCVIPAQTTTNTIVAYFMLDDFKDEVKKYFNSRYSIEEFDDKSPMAAPKTMIDLELSV